MANLLWALEKRNNLDTSLVDDIVLGCVTPVGEQGADIARVAAIYAKWAESVAGVTQSRFCASGLESVNLAAMKVMSGFEDLVVAGGVESMSRWAMGTDGGAWAMDPRVNQQTGFAPQGIGADTIATLEGWSREDVDNFAVASQKKAAHAREKGYFSKSLIPVTDINGMVVLDNDEFIRADASLEGLSGLKPSFEAMGQMGFDATILRKYTTLEKINHVHHAGNSSGIVDGAGLMLIGSKKMGRKLGLKPRARIVQTAVIGSEPTIMLTGIGPASKKALGKAKMSAKDIDLFEINEAFAAVVMRAQRISTSTPPRSTSMAAPSPWATRWAPPAASCWAPCSTSWSARTSRPGWPRSASVPAWVSPPSSNAFKPSGNTEHDRSEI